MSRRRPYRGPSEAQINAEALMRRGAPYSAASDVSFRVSWDFHRREPSDLREAVRMVRKAYADEIPTKLHEGYDSIGEGGTPKMTARAEGYIMGSSEASDGRPDPETGERPLISYYHTPFRATLARWLRGNEGSRIRALIVQHVTIGQQSPSDAAIEEGVPRWCAKVVAWDALSSFHRDMSDMKIDAKRVANEEAVA
jgi:hypothetical protein